VLAASGLADIRVDVHGRGPALNSKAAERFLFLR
jgi:hypothetical protein